MTKSRIEKESIIADYLTGDNSYRKLGIKYGIDYRLIHSWVMQTQGVLKQRPKQRKEPTKEEIPLSNEVKQLQSALRKSELHNKLLNSMIDIAEDELKISIRKKRGTKQ